jgi:hypothetical protein
LKIPDIQRAFDITSSHMKKCLATIRRQPILPRVQWWMYEQLHTQR